VGEPGVDCAAACDQMFECASGFAQRDLEACLDRCRCERAEIGERAECLAAAQAHHACIAALDCTAIEQLDDDASAMCAEAVRSRLLACPAN
jgi:hypothetical protein